MPTNPNFYFFSGKFYFYLSLKRAYFGKFPKKISFKVLSRLLSLKKPPYLSGDTGWREGGG
jgi:hypothetical protein